MNVPSITCPHCGMTSYHPVDIEKRYCGNCHRFHDDEPPFDLDAHAHDNERDKSIWRSLRRAPAAPEEKR